MTKNAEQCNLLLEDFEEQEKGDVQKISARNANLHKGAAAVLVHWPEHATACLQMAILTGIGLSLFIFLSVITAASSSHFRKCSSENPRISPTIHSCFLNQITNQEIQLITNISDLYPTKTIRIIVLSDKKKLSNSIKNMTNNSDTFEASKYENVIEKHHNIEFIATGIEEYFGKSILHSAWRKLDHSGMLLACRAIAIWNFGGTALDIGLYLNNSGTSDGLEKSKRTIHNVESIMIVKSKVFKNRQKANETLLKANTTNVVQIVPLNSTENISIITSYKIYDIFNVFKANIGKKIIDQSSAPDRSILSNKIDVKNQSVISIPEALSENALLHGRGGSVISTCEPCHAFIWEVLFSAKLGSKTADDITINAVKSFCRGENVANCHGLKVV